MLQYILSELEELIDGFMSEEISGYLEKINVHLLL